MTDRRNFLRTLLALSAAVAAGATPKAWTPGRVLTRLRPKTLKFANGSVIRGLPLYGDVGPMRSALADIPPVRHELTVRFGEDDTP